MAKAPQKPAPKTVQGPTPVKSWQRTPDGIICQTRPGCLRLQAWNEGAIRVTYSPTADFSTRPSLSVIGSPQPDIVQDLRATRQELILTTATLAAHINRKTGAVTFRDAAGEVITAEVSRTLTPATVCREQTWNIAQSFTLTRDEGLYGLGQHQKGQMNYRGERVVLFQTNKVAVLPVMVSSRGYGILWDNASHTEFEDGAWSSEVGDGVDYYFLQGPTLDGVVTRYRQLTGTAPLFGKWAYGLWQSKEHYHTQDELLGVVREYRRRGIPLDNIVQDWYYWNPAPWGSHQFDPDRYPDPVGMIQELHEQYKVHFMLSVWGKFEVGSENHQRMKRAGFLYRSFENEAWFDTYNPAARDLYWKQIKNQLFCKGVDAWWLDATEPELAGWDTTEALAKVLMRPSIGTPARYLNAYSMGSCQAVYEGQRATTRDKRVCILTRSVWTGQQRFAAATWSGDIGASWDIYRRQISAGLNFCLSGVPYWTMDIGAFFAPFEGGNQNPEYRELFTRWFQFGAFCPLFRVHGTMTPREMWFFGEEDSPIYQAQLRTDQLRYRLLPYIYSLAGRVTQQHDTILRALVMDFPTDRKVLGIDNQYLFGPAFLVNPVTEYKATSRLVYLPKCTGWHDFWTGKPAKPGTQVKAAAPIEQIPLYVRAGSLVPMGPHVQYSTEKPADPIELRIYPGADGTFSLYEDENDNYNYENGAWSRITFQWQDRQRTLTIQSREGSFPGMLAERTFHLVLVQPAHGAGLEPCQKPDTTVAYHGEAVRVTL